jgi:hypothetical protein
MSKKISESRSDIRRKMRRLRLKWLEDVKKLFRRAKSEKMPGKGNREEWSRHRGGQASQSTMEPRNKHKHLVKMTA